MFRLHAIWMLIWFKEKNRAQFCRTFHEIHIGLWGHIALYCDLRVAHTAAADIKRANLRLAQIFQAAIRLPPAYSL